MAEKRINGRTFEVKPMLATKALILQARIARLAGPAVSRLGEILQGYTEGASEEAIARSAVAGVEAFSTIFADDGAGRPGGSDSGGCRARERPA